MSVAFAFPIPDLSLGIDCQEMKSRALLSEPGTPVGVLIANGKADIGLQQISELVPVPGIDIVGPLPDDLQKISVFSAGVFADTKHPAAAAKLVAYLASPELVPVLERKVGRILVNGIDTVTCGAD